MTVYRRLVRLYPSAFRSEYGDDLVALFEEQRADEGALRCWARATRDLLVSIPTQHLEVRMHKPSQRTVTILAAIGAITAVLGISVLGTMTAPLLLIVAAVCAVAAHASWKQEQEIAVDNVSSAPSWWKLIVAGLGVLGVIALATTFWPPSLDLRGDLAWMLVFFSTMTAIALVGAGVMLGAVQLISRLRASH